MEREERDDDNAFDDPRLIRTVAGIFAVVILLAVAMLSGSFDQQSLAELTMMALALIAALVGIERVT